MEVKLFKLGGHEYVFHFGVKRTGEQKSTKKRSSLQNTRDYVFIPKNKYGYTKDDVSRHIGLTKYSKIMEKISEIVEKIPEEPTKTALVTDELKCIVSDLEPAFLNMIARVHESNPLKDTHQQQWLLVSSNWGNTSKINKKKI